MNIKELKEAAKRAGNPMPDEETAEKILKAINEGETMAVEREQQLEKRLDEIAYELQESGGDADTIARLWDEEDKIRAELEGEKGVSQRDLLAGLNVLAVRKDD